MRIPFLKNPLAIRSSTVVSLENKLGLRTRDLIPSVINLDIAAIE